MKILTCGLLFFSLLSCNAVFGFELTGFARNYEMLSENSGFQIKTSGNIVPKIKIGNVQLHFEEKNLNYIHTLLGGRIRRGDKTSWICFSSFGENRTYWFLSNNELQHGDISGVAISWLDNKSGCDVREDKIHISLKNIIVGSSKAELLAAYGLKDTLQQRNLLRLSSEKSIEGDFTQLNEADYYLKGGKVYGVLFTQVTTN